MIPIGGPAIGRREPAAVPATLLPLVFDPDTGRLFWLDPDRRLVASPVDAGGRTSLAAPAPVPLPHGDERGDIADITGRPLPQPVAAPPADGHEEYIVAWVDNSYATRTPRQAAEQAWRTIRRPGSHACVFQVVNRRTGERIEVDLLDDEDHTRAAQPGSPSCATPT